MAKVSLKNVSKVYPGGIKAVEHLSFEVKDREFVVLVGPSGCGKTTILRMIAGLEECSSGQIYIDDVLVNHIPAKDRNIAMVFQSYALYPHMNAFENMAFGLILRKYPKAEIIRRVNEAAQTLGISYLLKRKPAELSGGERQRVALGRVIVRKPAVFLFDEPLSNLDAKLRMQLRTEIHKLHIRLQTTMIYVTHDQIEAMTMGERIVVIKDGLVQQIGEPLEIYRQPRNKFVAGFIGSVPMNFLYGKIIKKDSRLYFDDGANIRVKLLEDMQEKLFAYLEKEVILGIRAEDIYDKLFVSHAPPENIARVRCEVYEPLGSEVYLHLNSGRNTFIARVGAHERPQINQDLDIVFDMSKVHFFERHRRNYLLTVIF